MDTLALDYAKGMLNTIELDRALGHVFGTCEHEEHDYHATAWDVLEDVLDIQYVIGSDRKYIGARLLLTFGGPNTWLDTRTGNLTTYWGDEATVHLPNAFVEPLDEAVAELWEMGN